MNRWPVILVSIVFAAGVLFYVMSTPTERTPKNDDLVNSNGWATTWRDELQTRIDSVRERDMKHELSKPGTLLASETAGVFPYSQFEGHQDEAVSFLRRVFETDSNPLVRAHVLLLMIRVGGASVRADLLQTLSAENDNDLCRVAAEGLALHGDTASIIKLADMLSTSAENEIHIIRALEYLLKAFPPYSDLNQLSQDRQLSERRRRILAEYQRWKGTVSAN